ncbi:hypothetical protein BU17DRAFT_63462 [Hysterangium stoloniferum]|nr:hypothetical protein BU17DRAFT_63462 [Hysterangium stoloniferum]
MLPLIINYYPMLPQKGSFLKLVALVARWSAISHGKTGIHVVSQIPAEATIDMCFLPIMKERGCQIKIYLKGCIFALKGFIAILSAKHVESAKKNELVGGKGPRPTFGGGILPFVPDPSLKERDQPNDEGDNLLDVWTNGGPMGYYMSTLHPMPVSPLLIHSQIHYHC